MTETQPLVVATKRDDHWIVSYCVHIDPGDAVPVYTHAVISKCDESGETPHWTDVSEQTFHGISAMPPTAGHQVIPYLVYHLDQVRAWLVAAHEAEVLTDQVRYISAAIGAKTKPDLRVIE